MLLKFQKGFTLTELLVVIAIFGILAGFGIANYKNMGSKTETESYAQKFNSVLKQAQMMAITGETIDGSRAYAYGVYIIDSNNYVLFADKDGSDSRNAGDKDLQTFSLPTDIVADSTTFDFIFRVPMGEIKINGTVNIVHEVKFFYQSTEKAKVIIDGRSGQIDIQ